MVKTSRRSIFQLYVYLYITARPSVGNDDDKLDVAEYRYTSCDTDGARMKNTFVEKLKQSEFRYLCEENENDCVPENVHLHCSQ